MAVNDIAAASLADALAILELLFQTPTRELVEGVATGALGSDVRAVAAELDFGLDETAALENWLLAAETECRAAGEPFTATRVEHTRLFHNPAGPAVWCCEAQFLHYLALGKDTKIEPPQAIVNPSASDAERIYRSAGMARSPKVNISADNITTELEFLCRMYTAAAQGAESSGKCREAAREFVERHVRRWFGAFFRSCADESRHPLYRMAGVFGLAVTKRLE